MRDQIRIKQIMPIPDGYTVLSPVHSEGGKVEICSLETQGWHYMFVLVDGGEWDDDYVSLYEMDAFGCGELCSGVRIVPRRKCPDCGREMTPHWDRDDQSGYPLWYSCECSPGKEIRTIDRKNCKAV